MPNQYQTDRKLIDSIVSIALDNGFDVDIYDESGEHFQDVNFSDDVGNGIGSLEMLDLVLTNKQTNEGHAIMLVNNADSLIADYDDDLASNPIFSDLIEKYEA